MATIGAGSWDPLTSPLAPRKLTIHHVDRHDLDFGYMGRGKYLEVTYAASIGQVVGTAMYRLLRPE